MTANILSAGVDLDTLFAPHVTNNAANLVNYLVAGVDIQTRYDPLSNPAQQNLGSRIPATNLRTSSAGWGANTDLASIFCGNATQYSITSPAGGSFSQTGGWISSQVWTNTITVTFANPVALSNFFFYGGRIQVSASQGSGTVADNTLATMFNNMGTIVIYDQGHYKTGAGGTIQNPGTGGANIGTTRTTLFNTTDGSPYTATTYSMDIVANAAPGAATTLTIRTILNTVTAGTIADTYTGTYTTTVQQRNHPTQAIPTFSNTIVGGGTGLSVTSPGSSAKQIKASNGTTTDGLYWIKASPNTPAQQIWSDMNIDGGGWMLVARTHPSASLPVGTFGWRGTGTGAPTTFGQAYQLNLLSLFNNGYRFTEYIFGNQLTNNSNSWGPFVYKVGLGDNTSMMTSDTQQSGSYSTIKSDTNVYGSTAYPGMQGAIGFCSTGTAENLYYMRDCCGYSTYGMYPTGMNTTYCSSGGQPFFCGPWCAGSSLSGNNWVQGGSSSATNTGGTNQAMLMVR